LDLLYTNDDQLESITPNYNVTDVKQRLSDHALISIRMNVNNVKKQLKKANMCNTVTSFENFDFFKCSQEKWVDLNDTLANIEWVDTGNPSTILEQFFFFLLHAFPKHYQGYPKNF